MSKHGQPVSTKKKKNRPMKILFIILEKQEEEINLVYKHIVEELI